MTSDLTFRGAMESEKSLTVLLTNDDGYRAKGITTLADYLEEIADVRIVAPRANQSAVSHKAAVAGTIPWKRIAYCHRDIYVVEGTPSDCVFEGLNSFYPDEIDLVISGINQGGNMGTDLVMSGTVAGAREAAFLHQGRVGIAISAAYSDDHPPDYDLAAEFCCEFASWAARSLLDPAKQPLFKGVYFNLNAPPPLPNQIRGVALTRPSADPGAIGWCDRVSDKGKRGKDRRRWKRGANDCKVGSDVWAIQNGYLSVSVHSILADTVEESEARQRRRDLEALLLEEFSFRSYSLERFGQNT